MYVRAAAAAPGLITLVFVADVQELDRILCCRRHILHHSSQSPIHVHETPTLFFVVNSLTS
jgi:hypothetical protein